MNLPNKLTMLRMALIPFFLVFMFCGAIPYRYLWALVIFAAASITDFLDGSIARKRGLVTNFGKFMDPLADKLLTIAAMVCLVDILKHPYLPWLPVVALILILSRELAVTALRTLAADAGVVIAADRWGKIKTVCQMVWVCYGLLFLGYAELLHAANDFSIPPAWMLNLYWGGMAVVVIATVASGINYLWKNRQLFMSSK